MTYDLDAVLGPDRACLRADWRIFFAEDTKRAKAVCGGCPVIDACRQYALAHEKWGVWGGLSEDERRAWLQAAPELRDAIANPLTEDEQDANDPGEKKRCSGCTRTRPLTRFNKCRASKDGLEFRCRECMSAYKLRRAMVAA